MSIRVPSGGPTIQPSSPEESGKPHIQPVPAEPRSGPEKPVFSPNPEDAVAASKGIARQPSVANAADPFIEDLKRRLDQAGKKSR